MTEETMRTLVTATQRAYQALESKSRPTSEVYADLTTTFATHGLDANTAESAVDWLEGGSLVESLEYALRQIRREHIHVWSPSGSCMVDDCNVICGLHDPDEWCHECGAQFWVDENGAAFHLSADTPDQIDHDADANHVPYSLSDEED